uniref:Antitoxin n=1 Tax=uncultured Thiotrichaceae bacterium TaxID=298394 RepID=A0A6S6STP2_9GAMM|nr:MAG: Unknown protein [uncultured Thiotrichaceae bacterium]
MEQLTVRGFEPQLAKILKRISHEEQVSLNQAALRLMRKGAGLQAKQENNIGNQLDEFIGSWSDKEAEAFNEQADQLRTIDKEMWK